MSTLQEATYYAALIYFSLAILTLFIIGISALVIIKKITKTKKKINEKINVLSNLPYISKYVVKTVKESLK